MASEHVVVHSNVSKGFTFFYSVVFELLSNVVAKSRIYLTKYRINSTTLRPSLQPRIGVGMGRIRPDLQVFLDPPYGSRVSNL